MSDTRTPVELPAMSEAVPAAEQRFRATGRGWLVDTCLLLFWLVGTDWLLYRVGTRMSWGLFLVAAVLFLAVVRHRSLHWKGSLAAGALIGLLSLKLIWCGSELQIACGSWLLICYAMALTGLPPFLPEVVAFLGMMIVGAARRIRGIQHVSSGSAPTGVGRPGIALQLFLPLAVVVVFAGLFVLANPDLARTVGTNIRLGWNWLFQSISRFELGEAVFLLLSAIVLLGALHPARTYIMRERRALGQPVGSELTSSYSAYRNTLVSVILLFAIYLTYELSTLWFREFPNNFYYAGYAHRGAFWLTVALALSTLVLSLIFQGAVLKDPRLAFLKRLALIWSIENFILSAAVYNRLMIYIDFNGLTRMRVIGLIGITSVVIGFLLVLIKLWQDRDFIWLLHRQLWVPALAIIAYAILPVDWLVNRYNVNQIIGGNPAPSVQIIAHKTSAEGMLPLFALVDNQDTAIREGVRALLAAWAIELKVEHEASAESTGHQVAPEVWHSQYGHSTPWLDSRQAFSERGSYSMSSLRREPAPWLKYQMSESLLRSRLLQSEAKWSSYAFDSGSRQDALNVYFKYAYQWY